MPKVTMPKDHPSAALIVNGQRVERGQSVEVDADLAALLAEQGWSQPKAPAKKAAPIKKATSDDQPTTDASADADPKES